MRDDIAKRVAARMRVASMHKRAYDPYESDEPLHDPAPTCRGINDQGCKVDGHGEESNPGYLCDSCLDAVNLAAMEEFLPWDLMEEKSPELYAQFDQAYQNAKSNAPGNTSGYVKNWAEYEEVVQKWKGVANEITSKLGVDHADA